MGSKRLLAALAASVLILALASGAAAGEVKVMVVVGLLDFGEDAKVVSVADFNKYRSDYEDFRKLLAGAPTLAGMAGDGWTIVHVGRATGDYNVIIFEKGTRPY